jgi:hypothetical protein
VRAHLQLGDIINALKLLGYCGEPCWVRTSDLLIKSQLLYRLS